MRFVTAWRRRRSAAVDTVAARLRLHRKLDRLKDLYLDGGIDKAEYQARKAPCSEELAALPAEGNPDEGLARRLAGFLANMASAWQAATPEERNRLAGSCSRRPSWKQDGRGGGATTELAPFFDLVSVKGVTAEATGIARAVPTGSCGRHRPRGAPGSPSALHGTAPEQALPHADRRHRVCGRHRPDPSGRRRRLWRLSGARPTTCQSARGAGACGPVTAVVQQFDVAAAAGRIHA